MKASEMDIEELKALKKEMKLPITKPLIYYKQIEYLKFESHMVIDFEITKEYSESKTLKLYLENDTTVLILSDYLSEMQKSNFPKLLSE